MKEFGIGATDGMQEDSCPRLASWVIPGFILNLTARERNAFQAKVCMMDYVIVETTADNVDADLGRLYSLLGGKEAYEK